MTPATLRTTITTAMLGAPAVALAHPGHGSSEPDSWLHYLGEAIHSGPLWLGLGAIAAVGLGLRTWIRLRGPRG